MELLVFNIARELLFQINQVDAVIAQCEQMPLDVYVELALTALGNKKDKLLAEFAAL